MKSKACPSFYNNLPIWATSPSLLQKNVDTPSMIFKKTQPAINNEKGAGDLGEGFMVYIFIMISWSSTNSEMNEGYIWVWSTM